MAKPFIHPEASCHSDRVGEDEGGVYVLIGGQKVRPHLISDPLSLGREKR